MARPPIAVKTVRQLKDEVSLPIQTHFPIEPDRKALFIRILIALLAEKRAHKLKRMAEWRARNPNRRKEWTLENRQHVTDYERTYCKINRDRINANKRKRNAANPERYRIRRRHWNAANPDKVRESRRRTSAKMFIKHPHLFLVKRMRAVVHQTLKGKPKRRTEELMGCGRRFFARWIESQFVPGMGWHNRKAWHVDHIFPRRCCGKDLEEVRKSFHYLNLRPMWDADNRKKHDKLEEASIVSAYLCGITTIHLVRPDQASESLLEKAKRVGFQVIKHFDASAV